MLTLVPDPFVCVWYETKPACECKLSQQPQPMHFLALFFVSRRTFSWSARSMPPRRSKVPSQRPKVMNFSHLNPWPVACLQSITKFSIEKQREGSLYENWRPSKPWEQGMKAWEW